ncbi:MAG: UDP-N-acetylglucosamine 2-epimerase (non-hydrolyzing) [Firmicutes bacterium]|nr:UDP-N-acetylglucosamine 2-epimerase (non-hydrolyzing) [Bacillota bacterium]
MNSLDSTTDRPFTVLTVIGTRPEAVKLAPVIQRLDALAQQEPGAVRSVVALTAQHRTLVDQMLAVFGITAHYDLDLMRPGQTLFELTGGVLHGMRGVLEAVRPDIVLVQGDTTTVFATSLAAFYLRIPVGHVEAGLRSGDRYNPFPEELNRALTARLATLHFAPTERARQNLLREGIPPGSIHVTGNTVIDALRWVRVSGRTRAVDLAACGVPPAAVAGRRLVLVTLHRRESWGAPMAAACRALRRAVEAFPDLVLVFPMHPNPTVRATVQAVLADHPRAVLIEPLDYVPFVALLERAALVVTDSGGLQEEAPALGVPVLVARETTERPEALEAGVARLVGTDEGRVYGAIAELLTDPAAYRAMARGASPFGDGHAAARIVAILRTWHARCRHARRSPQEREHGPVRCC